MSTEKTKKTGKIIIVILGVAILFFLLLPFLEEENASANAEAKKATPQIFTSNPLSDLVRKVYAMFSRGQKRQQHPAIGNSVLQEENFLAQAPTQDQRFSAAHETNDFSSTVNTNYGDYGPAGFINENGEWVMVQQTAPDVAQPGMHEVNVSDNAYDKYVRLERAAKYTGSSTTTTEQIPDSKWARLWKPIKKLFGADKEDKNTISPTHTDKSFALAAANSKNSQTTRTPSERFKRALEPSLKNISSNLPIINGQPTDILNMLNPDAAIDKTADDLKETARKILGKKEAEQREKEIDDEAQRAKQEIREERIKQMQEQAAQYEYQPLMAYTLIPGCDGATTFYHDPNTLNTTCTPASYMPEQTPEQQVLRDYFRENDVQTIPVLDITKAGDNPLNYLTDLEQTAQQAKKYINKCADGGNESKCGNDSILRQSYNREVIIRTVRALYEDAGCDQQDCVWIAYDKSPSAKPVNDLLDVAGLTPLTNFSNKASDDPVQRVIGKLYEQDPEFWAYNQDSGGQPISTNYRPVQLKKWANDFATYDKEHLTSNGNPTTYIYPVSPTITTVLVDNGLDPLRIVMPTIGPDSSIYGASPFNGNFPNWQAEQRGTSLLEDFVKNATDRDELANKKTQDLAKKETPQIVEEASKQEIEKIKKEGLPAQYDFHTSYPLQGK